MLISSNISRLGSMVLFYYSIAFRPEKATLFSNVSQKNQAFSGKMFSFPVDKSSFSCYSYENVENSKPYTAKDFSG